MSIAGFQTWLRGMGYPAGASDGIRGKNTTEAAFAYAWDRFMEQAPKGATIDPRALALIKEFEGFRPETYRDPVGILTIGYGTTKAAGVGIDPQPGMRISEDEAEKYLMRALDKFGDQIRPLMKREPTPAQYGAMLSLAYNIGPGAFSGSTVLERFNKGDLDGAAEAFHWWKRAGGRVLKGLVRRRAAEAELFLKSESPPG